VNNEVAGKEGVLRRGRSCGPVKQMPEIRHTLRKGLVLTPHQKSGGGGFLKMHSIFFIILKASIFLIITLNNCILYCHRFWLQNKSVFMPKE